MTKIVFKTPCFQDKNYQQELGAILPAWRWARIACHGNIKTVTNVFIQSKTETTCGLPSKPKKSDNTQAKEAKATPELIMPANDFGTWRKPIPLIKKPSSGRRGMSVIKDIMFSYEL